MEWSKKFTYLPQYEYVSTNQHGCRYRKVDSKQLSVAILSADCGNATDLRTLILLSHRLDVPVHYDFDEQKAFIEVVGKEVL